MLNWLRRQWLTHVLPVVESWDHIAPTSDAIGCDASGLAATDLECLNEMTDGSLPAIPDPQPNEAPIMKDVLQAKSLRALHEAVELHCQVMNGSGIVTKFLVIAESVDANLDNDTDKRSLNMLTSSDLTPWDIVGFSAALTQACYAGTI